MLCDFLIILIGGTFIYSRTICVFVSFSPGGEQSLKRRIILPGYNKPAHTLFVLFLDQISNNKNCMRLERCYMMNKVFFFQRKVSDIEPSKKVWFLQFNSSVFPLFKTIRTMSSNRDYPDAPPNAIALWLSCRFSFALRQLKRVMIVNSECDHRNKIINPLVYPSP